MEVSGGDGVGGGGGGGDGGGGEEGGGGGGGGRVVGKSRRLRERGDITDSSSSED